MLDLKTLHEVYTALAEYESACISERIGINTTDKLDETFGKMIAAHDAAQIVLDMIQNTVRQVSTP